MRTCPVLFCLLLALPGVAAECDYVKLVKCFIEVLDDWAWTLYESRDNVITISETGCDHFRSIRHCIQDTHVDDVKGPHGCTQPEIIETSRTVSDLLTHRKHSGTFLKSYYLLEYACTEGRAEITENRECLNTEMIGQQTLSAASYMEEKFKESTPRDAEDACSMFTTKLLEFRKIIAQQNLCGGKAERVMCESLRRMFVNVEADLLGDCEFNCASPDGAFPIVESGASEDVPSEAGPVSGLNGENKTGGAATAFVSALGVAAAALLPLLSAPR